MIFAMRGPARHDKVSATKLTHTWKCRNLLPEPMNLVNIQGHKTSEDLRAPLDGSTNGRVTKRSRDIVAVFTTIVAYIC
jgi:hypothetical protein